MAPTTLSVDWTWVRKELLSTEKIPSRKRSPVLVAAETVLRTARPLVEPKIVAKTVRITTLDTHTITAENGLILTSATLAKNLAMAQELYFFAVTIGAVLERKASRLMAHEEQLKGYLLDRVGSLAVESLAENAELQLRARCTKKGKSCSMRYSPGYCGWPVEEQRTLAKALDLSKAGISLTDACMMYPKKSISAVIGIGPQRAFKKRSPSCIVCDKNDCAYRRPG